MHSRPAGRGINPKTDPITEVKLGLNRGKVLRELNVPVDRLENKL
jgi:hypothetical protein